MVLQGWQQKCIQDGFRLKRSIRSTAKRARCSEEPVKRRFALLQDGQDARKLAEKEPAANMRRKVEVGAALKWIEMLREEGADLERQRLKAAILKILG